MLKIRVFNISKKELGRTLKKFRGTAWDQSPIFKKTYEEEYGQFGGQPYGLLVGDYSFDHSPTDVALLGDLSGDRLRGPRAVHRRRRADRHADGQLERARQSARPDQDFPDAGICRLALAARERGCALSRPVHATLPGAPAVRRQDRAGRGIRLRGRHRGRRQLALHLVHNAAYAMATNITRAFKMYGWCTRIRGIETGGAVEGLPAHSFPTDDGGVDMKCPTEIAISDRREAELAKNGFMPLIHKKNSDFAAFIGAQSLQKPQEYQDPAATANANLSARLPYLFASCRFAHYLKCMVRDKIGASMTKTQLTEWLQNWLEPICRRFA